MKVKEIASAIERVAPLYLQESYDNAGMQVGDPDSVITGVVLCTDVRECIVDEAIACDANLIISHHPLIFHGLKKLTGRNYVERTVLKAIRHGVSIYCAHTNLDNARGGVSYKMAEKLGMKNVEVLDPQVGTQRKIVCLCLKPRPPMWNRRCGALVLARWATTTAAVTVWKAKAASMPLMALTHSLAKWAWTMWKTRCVWRCW